MKKQQALEATTSMRNSVKQRKQASLLVLLSMKLTPRRWMEIEKEKDRRRRRKRSDGCETKTNQRMTWPESWEQESKRKRKRKKKRKTEDWGLVCRRDRKQDFVCTRHCCRS